VERFPYLWCNPRMAPPRALLLLGIALAGVASYWGSTSAAASRATRCAVTLPNGSKPPGSASEAMPPVPPAFDGNGKLWVKLWPLGVIVATSSVIHADGSIGIKLPWWHQSPGRLTIRAIRLDARAPVASAHVPDGYGATGFQASAIDFPSQGCWKVTGRVGRSSLTFVTLVVTATGNGY
jgi:hypothetical protein